MHGSKCYGDSPECRALIRLLISRIDVSSESPCRCLPHLGTFMVVSGAITGDRNANSATKGRDVMRLRRERHAAPRDREKWHIQSPDPNNIHQQDIWCSRGSGASGFPRIGPSASVCELAACAEASSCLLAGGAGLSGKSRTATEITRLRAFVASDWQKSPRRNALT